MIPQFVHDCEACIFLGVYMGSDLYACVAAGPTVIARRSDSGPDYLSGIPFTEHYPELREALSRAIDWGIFRE